MKDIASVGNAVNGATNETLPMVQDTWDRTIGLIASGVRMTHPCNFKDDRTAKQHIQYETGQSNGDGTAAVESSVTGALCFRFQNFQDGATCG
mmetsp:Transcript_2943/g.18510  ORF Transcript_2943/g.18510 Transcript_2943/m.18510 type:complete len:93 (-) Transcript_2943:1518-1796(-)